jgi:iron complex transport system substrate-binding protein
MMRWLLLLIAFPLLSHAAVERLVTLGGDVTEIVYALDAQQSLVARDSTSSWPAGGAKAAGCRLYAPAERRGDPRVTPAAGAGERPGAALAGLTQGAGERVKVVNVPGGENLSAIDNKVASLPTR